MEVYFIATGANQDIAFFEANMKSQLFNMVGRDPVGNPLSRQMFGMLQEVKLYRYVFPKEAKAIVCNTLTHPNGVDPIPTPIMWTMRKALGLKEIEKEQLPNQNVKLPVHMENLWVLPIGYKEDKEGLMHENGVTQEKL